MRRKRRFTIDIETIETHVALYIVHKKYRELKAIRILAREMSLPINDITVQKQVAYIRAFIGGNNEH